MRYNEATTIWLSIAELNELDRKKNRTRKNLMLYAAMSVDDGKNKKLNDFMVKKWVLKELFPSPSVL